jgi:hypothetical protein
MSPAPLILFTYKRLDILKRTIEKLQQNTLANQSVLYIYSDAAKHEEDETVINEVRKYLRSITGFKEVTVIEAINNKGLAKSIIDGVGEVLKQYDRAIVLEDDILTTTNFLTYMNDALSFYEDKKQVFSICGYSDNLKISPSYPYDVYFTKRGSSWGWATWKDRWEPIDWRVKDYNEFKKNRSLKKKFNEMGSDLSSMLKKRMEGRIDSWAIRWCYYQFKHNLYSVYPVVSKVHNIGFDTNATNMYGYKLIPAVNNDNLQSEFKFSDKIVIDKQVIAEFKKQYSIKIRIKNKLKFYFRTRILKAPK